MLSEIDGKNTEVDVLLAVTSAVILELARRGLINLDWVMTMAEVELVRILEAKSGGPEAQGQLRLFVDCNAEAGQCSRDPQERRKEKEVTKCPKTTRESR